MKTRRWILHSVIQPRTVPAGGLPGALRTDPQAWAARGILILALALGSLGASAAASSGYGSSGHHASAHQPAGNIRLIAGGYPISAEDSPFMF